MLHSLHVATSAVVLLWHKGQTVNTSLLIKSPLNTEVSSNINYRSTCNESKITSYFIQKTEMLHIKK